MRRLMPWVPEPYERFLRSVASFYLARLYLVTGHTPVLVYQMGKVGSLSVQHSLVTHGIRSIHIHRIRSIKPQPTRRISSDNAQTAVPQLLDKYLSRVKARFCRNLIARGLPVKFITLVREPIGRHVSAFFQHFERYTGATYERSDLSLQDLVRIFVGQKHFREPPRWFDTEMKPVLGIDVYDYPFPREKGYLSIKKDSWEVLILKLEIGDRVKEQAISALLGLHEFKLVRENQAERKNYAETYRAFTQAIQLPETYIEAMCDAKYTRHFYSEADIEAIRSKWQRNDQG